MGSCDQVKHYLILRGDLKLHRTYTLGTFRGSKMLNADKTSPEEANWLEMLILLSNRKAM